MNCNLYKVDFCPFRGRDAPFAPMARVVDDARQGNVKNSTPTSRSQSLPRTEPSQRFRRLGLFRGKRALQRRVANAIADVERRAVFNE